MLRLDSLHALTSCATTQEVTRRAEAPGPCTVADLVAVRPRHRAADGPEEIADPTEKNEETVLALGSEIADLLGVIARSVRL